jgi:hypothetical protein
MANARPGGWNDSIIAQFRARAKVADDAQRRRFYDNHAEWMPAFLDYEKKTTRKIPVIVLERI